MVGDIIWYATMLGCGALFVGIGIYAKRLEKPMWFWSGTNVDPDSITDIKAYNQENAKMWFCYSLWFWAAGVTWIFHQITALIVLVMGCTLGIVMLVGTYRKIEKKFKKTCL